MFTIPDVPVVALSAFVVVPNPAHARRSVVQAVLVAVRAWSQRLGEFPDDDLEDRTIVTNLLGMGKEHRRHILHASNISAKCLVMH